MKNGRTKIRRGKYSFGHSYFSARNAGIVPKPGPQYCWHAGVDALLRDLGRDRVHGDQELGGARLPVVVEVDRVQGGLLAEDLEGGVQGVVGGLARRVPPRRRGRRFLPLPLTPPRRRARSLRGPRPPRLLLVGAFLA